MTSRHAVRIGIACAAVGFSLASVSVLAADSRGSSDHPLVPRYEGSEIISSSQQEFTTYSLLTAPIKSSGGSAKHAVAMRHVEGRSTRIVYRAPEQRSPVEVMRNYEQALKSAGFERMFACAGAECGGRHFNQGLVTDSRLAGYYQDQHYLAARLSRPQGDVYVAAYVIKNEGGGKDNRNRAFVQLDVIESKPMESKMVVLAATEMQRDMTAQGRVALYGILFDTDKDSMRVDSKPQIEEIAKLLKASPRQRVLIVGHTDAQGTLEHNQDLSVRRARSIAEALAREHGIERSRLVPVGVGMAAPVGSNRTDEGRAKNRRVELVDAAS
jgi:OOP family OmpA-OmpF porin